jgi:hypothetical protein
MNEWPIKIIPCMERTTEQRAKGSREQRLGAFNKGIVVFCHQL